MVFKRAKLNNPQAAAQIKNRSLADILPDLKIASQRLESFMSDIRHYRDIELPEKNLRIFTNISIYLSFFNCS